MTEKDVCQGSCSDDIRTYVSIEPEKDFNVGSLAIKKGGAMEEHIIDVVRYGACVSTLIISVIAMYKADDNNAMRRLSALLGAVLILFNEEIGRITYLLIGSLIELWITLMGVGFVLIAGLIIMFLPVIGAFRWLKS